MNGSAPAPHHVLDEIVVLADRQRRWHDAGQTIARVAPRASAMLVIAAAGGLAMTGSVRFGWWLWLAATAGVAAFVLSARRARPATNSMAAQADADAQLEGELRSGHWFARHSNINADADPWTHFHVARAIARARAVAWDAVYPPVRGQRAAAAVALCAAVMLALPLGSGPLQRLGRWLTDRASLRIASTATHAPAGIRRLLERMLGGSNGTDAGTVPPLEAVSDADRQWALDNEAARLANRNAQDRLPLLANAPPSPLARGETAKEDLKSQIEAAIDAAAGATGLGGLQNLETPKALGEVEAEYSKDDPARPILIAALSREVIESKVEAEDLGDAAPDGRRKTEKGQSALEFSGALARTTFDTDHATAPAPVPEQRRLFLARYFARVTPPTGTQP